MLYDRNIHSHPYKEGDMVWLHSTVVPPHSHRKLHHPWAGPYQIVSKLSDFNYKIAPVDDLSKTFVVHFDRLKFLFSQYTFFLSTVLHSLSLNHHPHLIMLEIMLLSLTFQTMMV